MDSTGDLPVPGKMIEVWTHAASYTQRNGIHFASEPSWVRCYVRNDDPAFGRVIVVEQGVDRSFAVNGTHRWRECGE